MHGRTLFIVCQVVLVMYTADQPQAFNHAFDTVDHGVLLQRLLISHHINGQTLDWIRSYLTGRCESVLYSGDTTSAVLVEYGVPQGSMLGQLLFILYTSYVPRVINEYGLLSVVYADDTQIYIQVKQRDIPVAKVRVENCIEKVKQFLIRPTVTHG